MATLSVELFVLCMGLFCWFFLKNENIRPVVTCVYEHPSCLPPTGDIDGLLLVGYAESKILREEHLYWMCET